MFIQKNENDYQAALAGVKRANVAVKKAKDSKGDKADAMEYAKFTQKVNKAQIELNIYKEMKQQIEVSSAFMGKYVEDNIIRNFLSSIKHLINVVQSRKHKGKEVNDLADPQDHVEHYLSLLQNEYFLNNK